MPAKPTLSRFARSRRLLLCAALSAMPILPAAQAWATSTTANGNIELFGPIGDVLDADNTSEISCTIPIPAIASGRSFDYHINNPASECFGIRPTKIQMSNLPSAMSVLLTDDYFCNTALGTHFKARRDPSENRNFWIELQTTRASASLEEVGIDRLFSDIGNFATNSSFDGRRTSIGVKVVEGNRNGAGDRVVHNLSCLRISVSGGPSTTPGAQIPVSAPADWDDGVKESESADWTCAAGTVLVGRKHDGDENAKTYHKCAALGAAIKRADQTWSQEFPECGWSNRKEDNDDFKDCIDKQYENREMEYFYYSCPIDQVLIGRSHEGDERETTRYLCASLYTGDTSPRNLLTVKQGKWSEEIPEKEHEGRFTCPVNEVLVGRAHKGDENNTTRYLCGTLHAPSLAN